jgi:hypothetical protein
VSPGRIPGTNSQNSQPAELDARALPAQPLREPAALRQVVEDVPLRDVPEGRLEPDVQSAFGRLGGGGGEAFDTVAGDVDGVGVQVLADGPDVPAHPGGAPGGGGRLARADGVDDAVAFQSAPGRLRAAGRQHRRRPQRRRSRQELCPADPRCLLHAATVSAADGPVYGGATKG